MLTYEGVTLHGGCARQGHFDNAALQTSFMFDVLFLSSLFHWRTCRRGAFMSHPFIKKLLQGGNVWEKAGVNVSVVYGSMPPEAYR